MGVATAATGAAGLGGNSLARVPKNRRSKRAAEKPAAAAPKVVTPPKRKRAAACVASYKEPSRRQKLRNDGTWTKDGVKTRA